MDSEVQIITARNRANSCLLTKKAKKAARLAMSGTYPKTELSSPKAQTRRMTLAYGSNLRMMTRAKAALLKMIIQVPVLAHVTARKLVLCNQMLYQQLYKLSI